MTEKNSTKSDTDKKISDMAQGPAERAVLGKSPYGTMLRIVLFPLAFIVFFGTMFYFFSR